MRKKRGVLKLWMAIALTFAALAAVVGGTVLTLFLMGKFSEERILPEEIYFNQNLAEGDLGFYDNGCFYVANDFKMTISSTTEDATVKTVELRFGSTSSSADEDGFISNGVIKVPKYVTLDRAFNVVLERDNDGNVVGNLNAGQFKQTVLTAVSENVSARRPSVAIRVDVPVSEIEAAVHGNQASAEGAQEVVVGTQFTLDVSFNPQNSEYCFSDDSQHKKVFYSTSSSYIEYDWTTQKFVAKQISGSDTAQVIAYTFANAYYERAFMQRFNAQFPNATQRQLTESVLDYFTNNSYACIASSPLEIKVRNVKIDADKIDMKNINTPIRVVSNSDFTLTANSNFGNGSLGLSIVDEHNTPHSELFGNVGILLPKDVDLKITGGKVMKVVKNSDGTYTITKQDFDGNFDYAHDDAQYYILPNEMPTEYINYHWTFKSSSTTPYQTQLRVNYFEQTDNGQWKNLFTFASDATLEDENVEKVLDVDVSQNMYEEKYAWKDALQPIQMKINYNSSGAIEPGWVDLAEMLKPRDPSSVYTTIRYFLLADGADINLQNHFQCNPYVEYTLDYLNQTLSIENITMPNGGYKLYELGSSILTATSSFSSDAKVYVVAAKIIREDDGTYTIVNLSRAKQVEVSSTLSIANMNPTFSIVDAKDMWVASKGGYYIPATNLNDDGTTKTALELTLKLSIKSEGDAQKLLEAFATKDAEGNRMLDVLDGRGTNTYLKLESLSDPKIENGVATFTGVISINESEFNLNRNFDGQEFRLQLVYNDGKEIFTKNIYGTDADGLESFFVYYQRPDASAFTGAYLANHTGVTDGVLDDHIFVSNGNTASVKWIDRNGFETELAGSSMIEKIASLNKELSFTIVDQYGRAIHPSVYSVRLEEENEMFSPTTSPIIGLNNNSTQITNFSAAKDKTAYLTVYVVDNKTSDVNKYVYTDAAKQNKLTLPKIKFEITSEGVREIKIDPSDEVGVAVEEYETVVDSNGNKVTGAATVSKFVTNGVNDTIRLRDLIQIYTGTNTNPQSDLIFSLASGNHSEISKMVNFQYNDRNNPESITEMQFLAPFGTETTISFKITNQNRTFEVDFDFICKADASIGNTFKNYTTASNQQFLKTLSGRETPAVFGGESYSLDDFLAITSQKGNSYTWAGVLIGQIQSNQDGVFYDQSGGLCTINNGVLTIADVYSFTTVTFSLYYGVPSVLAPHQNVSLYVNPNIIVKEEVEKGENPFVNIGEPLPTLDTTFKFYRATSFIASGYDFSKTDEFTVRAANGQQQTYENLFTFTNVSDSADQFVDIQNGEYVLKAASEEKTLNLTLGQSFLQRFKINRQGEGLVDAIVVRMTNGQPVVTLSDPTSHTTLCVALGFGSDEADTLKYIFGQDVAYVTYKGQTHILLSAGENKAFVAGEGFRLASYSNDLRQGNGGIQGAQIGGIFSPTGNSKNTFTVSKTIGTNISVEIGMNAIVSRVGEKFVYYGQENAENKTFNTFGDVDFATLISDDAADLQSNNIFQVLPAGQSYTLGHNVANDTETNTTAGFYYDGRFGAHANFAIVSVEGRKNEQKTLLDNLASIDATTGILTIEHLAKGLYDEVYALIRLTLTYQNSNFSWFYRVKVEPSFTAGFVTYPYAEDVEHLDALSSYYISEEKGYKINLSEELTEENSNGKNKHKNRFSAPIFDSAVALDADAPENFSVTKVVVDGIDETSRMAQVLKIPQDELFTKEVNDIFFNLKVNPIYAQSQVSITIQKVYKVNGKFAVGSELSYTFAFNQADHFDHSLTYRGVATEDGKDDDILTAEDDVYSHTLTAGNGGGISTERLFEATLQINNDDINIRPITDFDAHIKGEGIENALMEGRLLKAGTTLTADDDDWTLEEDYLISWSKESPGQDTEVQIERNGKTYSVKTNETNYFKSFVYMTTGENNTRILHVCPQESVDKDYTFEVEFFTQQKVAFKLNLTVTSYFKWELNNTKDFAFKGGETYSFLNPNEAETPEANRDNNYIFQSISGGDFSNVTLELANAGQTIVLGPEFGSKELTLGDMVKIDNDGKTVTFAHLTQDVTLTFQATITALNDDKYTFNFDITALTSFTQTGVAYEDKEIYYGGDVLPEPTLANVDPIFVENAFVIKKADEAWKDEFAELTDERAEFQITDYEIAYVFNNGKEEKELFRIPLTVKYHSLPNVTVKANYPVVDGENELAYEYIAAKSAREGAPYTVTVNDFFGTKATFANAEQRISVADVTRVSGANPAPDGVDKHWTITLEDSSNVMVSCDGKTYPNSSSNILFNENFGRSSNVPSLALTFTLAEGTTNGSVVFGVEVNKIKTTYTVHVVRDNIVDIRSQYLNKVDEVETIYAEDLAKQEDKHIFAQDRILTYNLKTAGTYHLQFTSKTGQAKYVQISGVAGNNVVDLGMSLTGYTYTGVYGGFNSINNQPSDPRVNEDVFETLPTLTARVAAYYADGTKIALVNDTNLKYATNTDVLVEFTFAGNKDVSQYKESFEISLISVGFVSQKVKYSVALALDFDVTNNADKVTENALPTYVDLNAITSADEAAGRAPTLLSSQINNHLGIISSRTNQLYTQSTMAASGGRLTLKEYGFSDLKIGQDDALSEAAQDVHNTLTTFDRANQDGVMVRYHTGLTPRAGATINQIDNSQTNIRNYIVVKAIMEGDKATDWTIWAQGANNDGNFVMMQLTYTVDMGGAEVSTSHNVLFRVLPNSTITFKSISNNTVESETTQVYDQAKKQTIATNRLSPYQINAFNVTSGESGHVINLFDKVVANMNGSRTNTSNEFTYKYSANARSSETDSTAYNDWETLNTWFTTSGWKAEPNDVYSFKSTTANDLNIAITKNLALGERYFFVEFENDFGFKGRFYFTLTSANNPTIASADASFTEGDTLAFGLMYRNVDASNTVQYGEFKYRELEAEENPDGTKQTAYGNTIKIQQNANLQISDVKLSLTLATPIAASTNPQRAAIAAGTILTRSATIENGAINIIDNDIEWDYTLAEGEPGKIVLTQDQANGSNIILSFTIAGKQNSGTDGKGVYDTVVPFAATYQIDDNSKEKEELTVAYRVGAEVTPDIENLYSEDNQEDVKAINLRGINAYAFANSVGGVDVNSLIGEEYNFTSNVDEITVEKVEFFHQGKLLSENSYVGGATSKDNVASQNKTASLLTNSEVSFVGATRDDSSDGGIGATYSGVSKSKLTKKDVSTYHYEWIKTSDTSPQENKTYRYHPKILGFIETNKWIYQQKGANGEGREEDNPKGFDNGVFINNITYYEKVKVSDSQDTDIVINNTFKVPYIDGILFGTGNTLSGVEMQITLVDGNSANPNEAVISRTITLKRKEADKDRFVGTVLDDNSPEKTNDAGTIYNDTLEVVLAPHESISFVVNDSAVSGVNDGGMLLNESGTTTFYIKTTDTKLAENKTYYILNSENEYEKVETPQANELSTYYEAITKTAKLVTLTNTENYEVTKYVGISENIVGLQHNLNGKEGEVSDFYVYVTNHTARNEQTGRDEKVESAPRIFYNSNRDVAKNSLFEGNGRGEIYDSDGNVVSYTYNANKAIAAYDQTSGALKLRIANTAELSNKQKSQKLYFLLDGGNSKLYNGGNKIYQYTQTFTVCPQYDKAEKSGDILVSDYLKLSNGTSEYYVIPLNSWAKNLKLSNVTGETEDKITAENAYKFRFAISSTDGAAFIDENGTITTSEAFRISEGYFNLSIYMKVSGNDGKFEDLSTNILLGTFTVRLQPRTWSETADISAVQRGDTYIVKQTNSTSILTVPRGYGLYKGNESVEDRKCLTALPVENIPKYQTTLAYSVGSTIDLRTIFDDKTITKKNEDGTTTTLLDFKKGQNKTYHIVNDESKDVWFDNLNTLTLNTTGEHTVTAVVTYRTGGKNTVEACAFTFNVLVYDTSSSALRESKVEVVELKPDETGNTVAKFTLPSNNETTSGTQTTSATEYYTYFDLTNDETSNIPYATPATEANFTKAEKQTKQYLVEVRNSDSQDAPIISTKLVTYTFFVYENTKSVSIAMAQGSRYELSKLVKEGASGKFYFDGNEVTEAYFSTAGVGGSLTRAYMFVQDNGTVEQYKVRFKIVSGSGSQVTKETFVQLQEGVISNETIVSEVISALGLNPSMKDNDNLISSEDVSEKQGDYLLIEARANDNILTDVDAISVSGDVHRISQRFVVTYRIGTKTTMRTLTLNFNIFTPNGESSDGTHSFDYVAESENLGFEVSNWNDNVKEELRLTNSENVTYSISYFQIIDGELKEIETVNMEENQNTGKFYICVTTETKTEGEGETTTSQTSQYYLFNITYNA